MGEGSRHLAVVLGSSLGGVEALQGVLGSPCTELSVPVLVVHHVSVGVSWLESVLGGVSRLPLGQADVGAPVGAGPGLAGQRVDPGEDPGRGSWRRDAAERGRAELGAANRARPTAPARRLDPAAGRG